MASSPDVATPDLVTPDPVTPDLAGPESATRPAAQEPAALDRDLERALRAFQREQFVRQTLGLAVSAVSVVYVITRVVTRLLQVQPSHGWLGTPWSLTVLLGAFAAGVCRSLVLDARKVHVLDELRTGIAIDAVRRDVIAVRLGVGFIRVTKKTPTISIDLVNGKRLSIVSLGVDEQLADIEALLRKHRDQLRRAPRAAHEA